MDKIEILGIGFLIILLGAFMIWYTSTQPKSNLFSIKAKGYIAGVTFILIGIIYILNELHLW